MERKDKINYYLDIADAVLRVYLPAPPLRAIIVANDEIIATGYNGAPGRLNCIDTQYCARDASDSQRTAL